MARLVEIGGLIKKGLGHGVTEKFSKNKDVSYEKTIFKHTRKEYISMRTM